MDVFRIFDSLNLFESMKTSITAVRERTDGIAQACICYTGEVLNKSGENRLMIRIDAIQQSISVSIDRGFLKRRLSLTE